ncbi:uncharacterized protein J3D65DRAFT_326972 [Phyllosticta citribraziliensis]|uniref:T. brucei spp.-specific protein n=1 Tax=Phyllosticta citribraziliensis TaxID=989973 RepID=A0ABR1LTB8_9PEZI
MCIRYMCVCGVVVSSWGCCVHFGGRWNVHVSSHTTPCAFLSDIFFLTVLLFPNWGVFFFFFFLLLSFPSWSPCCHIAGCTRGILASLLFFSFCLFLRILLLCLLLSSPDADLELFNPSLPLLLVLFSPPIATTTNYYHLPTYLSSSYQFMELEVLLAYSSFHHGFSPASAVILTVWLAGWPFNACGVRLVGM